MSPLVILDVAISQDEYGRFCLNDFHRAAGGARRHGPSLWLENQQASDLIDEIAQEMGDTGNPVSVVKGGQKQGTYGVKELIYAYAMWISPSFHLKVIRAYDAMVTAELSRLNSLHMRAVRTELEYLEATEDASRCGLGLRRWRDQKPEMKARLDALRLEIQPALFAH